jgi:outer membrane protein assembly factor BamA
MKRVFCLVTALILAGPRAAPGQTLFEESGDGQADLGELLRLSGTFWDRLLGERGEGNPFESLSQGLDGFGVTPRIGGVVSGSGVGLGFTHTLWEDGRSSARWSALGTSEGYFRLSVLHETTLDDRGKLRLRTGLIHRDLAQEDFFGLGLGGSVLDRTDFSLKETVVGSAVEIALSGTVGLRVGADVRHLRSGAGENPRLPSPDTRFAAADLAGYGDSFSYGTIGASLYRDTRDAPGYPRRGSFVEGGVQQFLGLGSGDPGFRRFTAELQNVFPLPGHDHRLVTRLRADWIDRESGTQIPFFFTRGLGGSQSLRGFPLNRFRGEDLLFSTVEYRAAILPGKLDAVLFWDAGGAYRTFSDWTRAGVEHSFGGGVRVLKRNGVLLRLEVAQGSEGPRFLVSFSRPF